MSHQKFDPTRYKNKKTVYVSVPGVPGVSTIWDWSKRKKKYCKRTVGSKFYAVKRINKKQITKCFVQLVDAKKWQQSIEIELSIDNNEMTFKELREKYFAKKKNEIRVSTLETYESKAKHLEFFDDYPVESITPRTIDAWLEFVKSPKYLKVQHGSRLTYRHELSQLRQILDFYSEYVCEDNAYGLPIKKRHRKDCIVDRVKNRLAQEKNKRKFLPRKVIYEFLGALRKRALEKPRYEVFFVLGLFQFSTGTRVGEACAVDWIDVDLEMGTAFIHRNVCWSRKKGRETFVSELTKTGENRKVFLPRELAAELKKWSLKSGRNKGLVFSEDGFKPIEYRSVQYHYDKALKSIGSDWSGTHLLRHSFATDFLEQTQNPKALQGLLGHQTAQQTNHYAKITQNLMQKGMDKYEESYSDLAKVIEIGSC